MTVPATPLRFTPINGVAPTPDMMVWGRTPHNGERWFSVEDVMPMWQPVEPQDDEEDEWTVWSWRYGLITFGSIDIEEDN